MDILGIELGKGAWLVSHLKSYLGAVKTVKYFSIDASHQEEPLSGLKGYIERNRLKGARIALVLPPGSYGSKTLELPAPSRSALEGILKYEMEKHVCFRAEDSFYAFSVIEKKGNLYTVFLAAARKDAVEAFAGPFRKHGLAPEFIGARHSAHFDGTAFHKRLSKKAAGFISIEGNRARVDAYDGLLKPPVSRSIEASQPGMNGLFAALKKEAQYLCSPAGPFKRKMDFEWSVDVDGGNAETIADALCEALEAPALAVERGSVAYAAAIGGALGIIEKGKLNTNLLQAQEKPGYRRAAVLGAACALLAVSIGASHIARDLISARRFDAAIDGLKAGKQKIEGLSAALNDTRGRVKALGDMSKSTEKSLEVLNELSGLLPEGTWLTGFELKGNAVFMEGFSRSASSLVFSLSNSKLFKNPEFEGHIVKESGKEHFRLRCEMTDSRGGV